MFISKSDCIHGLQKNAVARFKSLLYSFKQKETGEKKQKFHLSKLTAKKYSKPTKWVLGYFTSE